MKKLFFLILLVCALCTPVVEAKSGDIAGKYYSTDIVTTLNGVEIDSINIGGQTLISAEDMYYYAFSVDWYAETRELQIRSQRYAENGDPPAVKKSSLPAGTPLGNYYETDIITYLDSRPITAYNLGGRTYIHAEQMRDFGYEVIWNAVTRSLHITSPDRIPDKFENYSFRLYYADHDSNKEAIGSFSVSYTDEKIIGTGDAELFDLSFSGTENGISFSLSLWPNQGLWHSAKLQKALDVLAYSGDGIDTPCDPAEKYESINKILRVAINGQEYTKIAIKAQTGTGMNTHRGYIISVTDAPLLQKKEIKKLEISLGEPQGEPYEIYKPVFDSTLALEYEEQLQKSRDDYFVSSNYTEKYFAITMRHSLRFGVATDALYIVDRETNKISEDLLDQVRAFEGFDSETMRVYGTKIGAVKTNFFFSCFIRRRTDEYTSEVMTGDFYVEMNTGKVHFISKNIW